MAILKNTKINDTGYLRLPSGTSAERPLSLSNGIIRYNNEEDQIEFYGSLKNDWLRNSPEKYSNSIIQTNLQLHFDASVNNSFFFDSIGRQRLHSWRNLVPGKNSFAYIKNNVVYSTEQSGCLITGGGGDSTVNNVVGDRIDIETTQAGIDRFGAHNFSIFFWVNQISSSGRLFATGSSEKGVDVDDNCIWQMWIDTGQFYWWNSSGGGANNISASGSWHTPGVWEMIGITYSYNENGNNIVRCFRDGLLVFSSTVSTSSHSFIDRSNQTNIQWTLGGGYLSSCRNTNTSAKFGAFYLYNRKLEPSEVMYNFNATKNRYL